MTFTSRLRRLLRPAAAVVLVGWLVNEIGPTTILNQFASTNVMLIFAAAALLAMDGVMKAWNWHQMLDANLDDYSVSLSFRRVVGWFFAGGFVGAVVPSSASTDACRVMLASRGVGGHAPACTASVVTLNALGWFAGCIVGIVAVVLLATQYTLPAALNAIGLFFALMLGALTVAYLLLAAQRARVIALLDRAVKRWPGIRRALATFLEALLVFRHARIRFPLLVLIAAGGVFAQSAMFAVTAHAVGIDLPFTVWMMLVPLTRIVALVPVSVADFGLIQAAHVSFLGLFGVLAWEAFALSTLFAVEGLLVHSTLGSATFLYSGRRTNAPRAAAGPV